MRDVVGVVLLVWIGCLVRHYGGKILQALCTLRLMLLRSEDMPCPVCQIEAHEQGRHGGAREQEYEG